MPRSTKRPPAVRWSTARAFNAACFAIRRLTCHGREQGCLVAASLLIEPDVTSAWCEELFLASATIRTPVADGPAVARSLTRRGYAAEMPKAVADLLRAVSHAVGVEFEPTVVDAIETVEKSTP